MPAGVCRLFLVVGLLIGQAAFAEDLSPTAEVPRVSPAETVGPALGHDPVAPPLGTEALFDRPLVPFDISLADDTVGPVRGLYDRLLQRSLENSPDIQLARKFQEQKAAQQFTARARRWAPRIDLQLSQEHLHNFGESPDGTDRLVTGSGSYDIYTDSDVSNWRFFLDMPLYRRSLSVAMQTADLEFELARTRLHIRTDQMRVDLVRLLGDYLLKSYKLLNLANSIALSREHLSTIERGYELRRQTRLQLLRARANLKILEGQRELDEQRQKESLRKLVRFTGLPTDDPLFASLDAMAASESGAAAGIIGLAALSRESLRLGPWISLDDREKLKRQFVAQSLIYHRLVLERRLADAEARRLVQDEFPALSVRGVVEKRSDARFLDMEGDGSIGLVLDIPLFSGGTLFSNYRAQDRAQQVALIRVSDSIRRTVFSLEDTRKLIVNLQRLLDKQKIHLSQQEEIVRLSVKSYALQRTSMQDLLTSWNTLIASKNNLMQTVTELGALLRRYAFELGLPVEAGAALSGQNPAAGRGAADSAGGGPER